MDGIRSIDGVVTSFKDLITADGVELLVPATFGAIGIMKVSTDRTVLDVVFLFISVVVA